MIYYTGDIHGSAKGIVAFAQHYELTESDIIVILGDVGANYYGNRRDRYCKDALAKIKSVENENDGYISKDLLKGLLVRIQDQIQIFRQTIPYFVTDRSSEMPIRIIICEL